VAYVVEEAELIRGVRRGDAQSFETLFRAYHARLCGFAYGYLHDRAAAEETVQDLFLAIWQKREQLEVRTTMSAYLFGALRNRVLNKSARARLEQRWLEHSPTAEIDSVTPAADDLAQASETADRVRAAIALLPPACQTVLMLRWREDLSYAEIAEALGVSVKTVENNLGRARQLLRQRLPDLLRFGG